MVNATKISNEDIDLENIDNLSEPENKPEISGNGNGNPESIHQRVRRNRRIIKTLKAKADTKRSRSEKAADWMTMMFGSMTFLVINGVWFVLWIVLNLGLVHKSLIFDPYPFGLLTMIVSLEAIFLSVFVLISQNRSSKIDELRSETDFQIGIIAEQELTKLMSITAMLAQRSGIDLSHDQQLQEMLKPTDTEKISKIIERQI